MHITFGTIVRKYFIAIPLHVRMGRGVQYHCIRLYFGYVVETWTYRLPAKNTRI